MCVAHEHNHVCKQKEHGRRLGVENRSWSFMEYYQWTSLWIFIKIFVYLKSTIGNAPPSSLMDSIESKGEDNGRRRN
jgi:hypothetical protein